MLTDVPPRKKNGPFLESDQIQTIPLPPDQRLLRITSAVERALKDGMSGDVRRTCQEFVQCAGDFYKVPTCDVRVLAARPLRVREHSTTEIFGDYNPDAMLIRVWMRTAIRKDITSFGTFFSTLCHEFCHHLDFHRFAFGNSWHTRGFYQRTAALYHHSRGTPMKQLIWAPVPRRRWRIDWPRTNRSEQRA